MPRDLRTRPSRLLTRPPICLLSGLSSGVLSGLFSGLLIGLSPPAAAQTVPAPEPAAAEPAKGDESAVTKAWDAALGVTASLRPQYPGAPRRSFKATPGFYFRYGRYTVTNASGFAPRRSEDVVRGLGVELVQNDRLRASLSLRYDSGRSEHGSAAYMGLGNIRPTARARAAASWQLDGPWRLGASWNVDTLGRGNGGVGDISASWERALNRETLLTLSSVLALGDSHYMQRYYGVTDAQSARSGYARYTAGAGLRDIGLFANLRHEVARDWVLLGGASATRLMGPAAASPITRERNGYGVSVGLARQF